MHNSDSQQKPKMLVGDPCLHECNTCRTATSTQRSPNIAVRCQTKPNFRLLATVLAVVLLLALYLESQHQVEGAPKLKKLVKGILFSQLTSRKNFLPVPLPIPVPIEINDPPVYIKGKPKYVNVYKPAPKPTPQPVIKPTTVYHMPVYSPTYEYMSSVPLDPMSMYSSPLAGIYSAPMSDVYGQSKVRSMVSTGPESTSSSAAMNFNDYDDESGNYYVRRAAAARRRKYAAAAASAQDYDTTLSRADDPTNSETHGEAEEENDADETSDYQSVASVPEDHQHLADQIQASANRIAHAEAAIADAVREERMRDSHTEDEDAPANGHKRTKRQVYYQSGYNGRENCHGFPLEINVRSRIKMDQMFPIHGNSQIKKCIPVGKPLLPPVESDHY